LKIFYYVILKNKKQKQKKKKVKSHALEGLYIDHARTMSLSLNDKEFSDLSTKLLDLAALDLGIFLFLFFFFSKNIILKPKHKIPKGHDWTAQLNSISKSNGGSDTSPEQSPTLISREATTAPTSTAGRQLFKTFGVARDMNEKGLQKSHKSDR